MIELDRDGLLFSFPEVHPGARLRIEFQRTLRIPDDDRTHFLPPGLGEFPLRHVDDFAARIPEQWLEHGGVMLPMYQAEAMWLWFHPEDVRERFTSYPFAIKVAAGKIDAVTGKQWSNGLQKAPQDYLVAPTQPWLDGYCVKKGVIRQFVAMPLGEGYTAEEQLTGKADHGGLQIVVYPMRREAYERWRSQSVLLCAPRMTLGAVSLDSGMGLAPGGQMRQQIYDDPHDFTDWETEHRSRCFVHIANSRVWEQVTGERPPMQPPSAKDYTKAGLPWFDYYDEGAKPLRGSKILKALKSVGKFAKGKGDPPPDSEDITPAVVLKLGPAAKKAQVREGRF